MSQNQTKIQWLTKSPSMYNYSVGDTSIQLSGGRLYEILATEVLKSNYNVSINPYFIKRETAIKYLVKNHKTSIDADICVLDPYILANGKFDTSKKNIAIIHHVDSGLNNHSITKKLFLKRMISNLKKVDLVVVVSEFWKSYLEQKGITNIEVIYNSYNTSDYNFSQSETDEFKSKYNLSKTKPIIYLGKLGNGKGVEKVLDYVDVSKYQVIVTGKKECLFEGISTHFFSELEFPLFLSACDVVICMSTMNEGWNRIAHESLLVKTPVIGSGTGGMRELLTKSEQIIVSDWTELEANIHKSLKNSTAFGQTGFKFVKQFDLHYFKSRWNEVIEKIS